MAVCEGFHNACIRNLQIEAEAVPFYFSVLCFRIEWCSTSLERSVLSLLRVILFELLSYGSVSWRESLFG